MGSSRSVDRGSGVAAASVVTPVTDARSRSTFRYAPDEGRRERAIEDGSSASRRPPPSVVGFEQLEEIGVGGFSTVYSARDSELHREVALKVLSFDASDHRRFRRECRILGMLSGVPGVVPVHHATFTTDGRPVIAMKLMAGGSLQRRLARSGPMDAESVLDMGLVLSRALQTAHDHRVFHRDIKPANVLFDEHGVPALGDFGIALVQDLLASTETIDSLSPPHAPPERVTGDADVDPLRCDVYSLGSTLYTALSGRPPFGTSEHGGMVGLLRRIAEAPVPPLGREDLPRDLEPVLRRAMAKDPADRFPDMGSFHGALAHCSPERSARWRVITASPYVLSADEAHQWWDEGLTGWSADPLVPARVGTESSDSAGHVPSGRVRDGRARSALLFALIAACLAIVALLVTLL